MATPSTYAFSFHDLAKLMIREARIKDGLWKVGVNFRFAALNMGANDDDLRPSALVGVNHLVLEKVTRRDGLTFDAAEIQAEAERANAE